MKAYLKNLAFVVVAIFATTFTCAPICMSKEEFSPCFMVVWFVVMIAGIAGVITYGQRKTERNRP